MNNKSRDPVFFQFGAESVYRLFKLRDQKCASRFSKKKKNEGMAYGLLTVIPPPPSLLLAQLALHTPAQVGRRPHLFAGPRPLTALVRWGPCDGSLAAAPRR